MATTDSFFGVIDAISGNLTDQLAQVSTALAGDPLSHEILLIMLVAEIALVIVLALTGGGAAAVQRGVEAMLYASFVFGLTGAGGWSNIVIPISKSFPNDIIAALHVAADPTTLKTDVTTQFSGIIANLMNPANIQPSARMPLPK